MKNILKLDISNKNSIIICVPNFNEKINWYYPVTQELHKFDEVRVIFESTLNCFLLSEDIISYIINRLKIFLDKLLQNTKEKPNEIVLGYMGYHWNKDIYSLMNNKDHDLPNKNIDLYTFVLWEGLNVNTYAYNFNRKIYIEISPIYQYNYNDANTKLSFEILSEKYTPLILLEIPKAVAISWLDMCEKLTKKLEIF